MSTKNIKCAGCGHVGKVETHTTVDATNKVDLFKILGKDPSSGFLYFRCPQCGEDIAVDPLKTIGANQMVGYTPTQMAAMKNSHSNRYVPIIMGLIGLAVAIFIIVKYNGWWTYIVGGIFFMFGWGSLKTGFFASDKEITELTEPGPISEDTKEKFQNRF